MYNIIVLYMNCAGLVQPANAEPLNSAADAEPSFPTPDTRIWWANAILPSWSAAGTQANMGAAGAVSHTPRGAGCQDAVGWFTFSKVRLAALGQSTRLTHTLHLHALHLQSTIAAAVVNYPCAHCTMIYHNTCAPPHSLSITSSLILMIYSLH